MSVVAALRGLGRLGAWGAVCAAGIVSRSASALPPGAGAGAAAAPRAAPGLAAGVDSNGESNAVTVGGDRLLGAGSGSHRWFVVRTEPGENRWSLLHQGPGADPLTARTLSILAAPPAWIAAWDSTVWLGHAPIVRGGSADVLTTTLSFNENHGYWYPSFGQSAGHAPRLPRGVSVLDALGTPAGLLVLVDRVDPPRRTLMRLGEAEWRPITVEPPFDPAAPAPSLAGIRAENGGFELLLVHPLAASGPSGVASVEAVDEDGRRSARVTNDADRQDGVAPNAATVETGDRVIDVAGSPVIVRRTSEGVEFRPIDGSRTPAFAATDSRDEALVVGGVAPLVIEGRSREALTGVTWPDWPAGDARRDAFVEGRIDPAKILRGPIIVGTAVFIAVIVAVLGSRPGAAPPAVAERLAPNSARLLAAAVDGAVPLMAVWLVFGHSPAVLIESLLLLGRGGPWPWISFATLWCFATIVGELGGGRTLGRLVAGIRVVDAEGAELDRGSLAIRFAIRTASVGFPPLGLFWLAHAQNRAIHDLAVGSWVVLAPTHRDSGTAGTGDPGA